MKLMEKIVIISSKYDEMSNMMKCRNVESKVVKFGEIGRSGEIGHFDEIVIKFKFNAMKLIENKSVVLSWVYLQPFCSTFFTFFTLFSIFNFTFFGSDKNTSALVRVCLYSDVIVISFSR